MQTKTLLINNLLTSYQSHTWTGERVLLFLHGRGRNKEDWKVYCSAIEEKAITKHPDFSEISYLTLDLPWFWKSDTPKEVRGVKEYSEFILQFLKKLNITQPIEIIAHSFGGRIAFFLAANYPEKIKKLYLIAPAGVEKNPPKTKQRMYNLGKSLLPQQAQHYLKNRMSSVDYKNAGKLQPIFKKVVNEDLRELLPQIFQPVHLYRWEQDDQIGQRQIEVMREKLPNLTFKAFPNNWHNIHQEKAEEILSDILDD